jgi:hypothetical protein
VIEDGDAVVLAFNSGPLAGLRRVDLETGAMSLISLPEDAGDEGGLIVDERRDALAGLRLMRDDLPEQRFTDPQLRDIHASLAQAIDGVLPGARVSLTSWTDDRSMFTVSAVQRGRPAQYFLFDGATGDLSILGSQVPALDETPLGSVEALRYDASDGLSIPAFLTLPPGKTRADGPFPLIALPHGGPRAHDTAQFDWVGSVLRLAGLCRAAAQFPRLDRLWPRFRAGRPWRVWRADDPGHRRRRCPSGARRRGARGRDIAPPAAPMAAMPR